MNNFMLMSLVLEVIVRLSGYNSPQLATTIKISNTERYSAAYGWVTHILT